MCVESWVSELASVSLAAHPCPSRYDICFADASLTLVWLQVKHRKLRIIVNHSFDSFILQLHYYTIKIEVTCHMCNPVSYNDSYSAEHRYPTSGESGQVRAMVNSVIISGVR